MLPNRYTYKDVGEKELDYPLNWDETEALTYDIINSADKSKIVKKSKLRIENSKKFALIKETNKILQKKMEDTNENLNLKSLITKRLQSLNDSNKLKEKQIEDELISVFSNDYHPTGAILSDEEKKDKEKKINDWHKQIRKDAHIDEAIWIIKDLNTSSK